MFDLIVRERTDDDLIYPPLGEAFKNHDRKGRIRLTLKCPSCEIGYVTENVISIDRQDLPTAEKAVRCPHCGFRRSLIKGMWRK